MAETQLNRHGRKDGYSYLECNLVSARRSRRVETVTRTSQWDYPGPLIGSLHPYILLCLSAFRSHIFLILN
ncbi:hypothetical protein OUZ56_004000 [Daphnia magna]|uniref:Uncharacterized protein n=1 Tax=Daphnia magna TaxID=35525 RepID=A0ABQ9YNF8_9CRUS|nr:hypothetical protein OUZ56_004000 [Daphnia magna]